MTTFNDLIFKNHQYMINAHYVFDNDWEISVSAGSGNYCTPKEGKKESNLDSSAYSSFEVAIFNPNGDFATKDVLQVDDDVIGRCGREDINNMIEMIIEQ